MNTPQAMAALLIWPVVAFLFFSSMRPHRAAIATTLAGWLFLPVASIPLPGLPDYSKPTAISLMLIVGAIIWASERIATIRWTWIDSAAAVVCVSPVFSSIANGLGAYDGIAEAMSWGLMWIGPYFAGRVFFRTGREVTELAYGVVLGGLAYVPLCLFEARMSPQLHTMVYGYFPHVFQQTYRLGGWRPNVFMNHGLMTGLWTTGSAMVAVILWRAKLLPRFFGLAPAFLIVLMLITGVLSRSAGAIGLSVMMFGLLWLSKTVKLSLFLKATWCIVAVYLAYRMTGGDAMWLVDLSKDIPVLGSRYDSLAYRFETEVLVVQHALERPLFGWGGWGRHGVQNDYGELETISDSLWILTLGQKGIVGLTALYVTLLAPVALGMSVLIKRGRWPEGYTPAVALTALLMIFVLDSLLNAMPGPIYPLIAGCLVTLHQAFKSAPRQRVPAPQPANGGAR